jgi:hypothetical protein
MPQPSSSRFPLARNKSDIVLGMSFGETKVLCVMLTTQGIDLNGGQILRSHSRQESDDDYDSIEPEGSNEST